MKEYYVHPAFIGLAFVFGVVLVALHHYFQKPAPSVLVTRSSFSCGCPAVNAHGEPFSHCIIWQADPPAPLRHQCGYKVEAK